MNFSKTLTLLMVSIMIASVYSDEPISCYVCNSAEDPSCDDPYSSHSQHKQECTNGETFCRKTIQNGNY